MVGKIYKSMTLAQIFTGLTLIVSLWADSIIIGKFCGANSLTAYGYVMPIMLLFNAIGQTLSQGVQINCGRAIGDGKHDETNRFFSTGYVATIAFSVVAMIAIVIWCPQISVFLGTTSATEVHFLANDYILGLVPGIPFMLLVLMLTPLMQFAGQQNRLVFGVLSMIVTDIALNFVAVYFFQKQMFGIGIASSASYFVCFVILVSYFFTNQSEFQFHLNQYSYGKFKKIIKEGLPTLINVLCSVLSTYAINQLLGNYGGDSAVAAYSIVSNVMNFCYTFSSAVASVTVTATALFGSEEDKQSLIEVLRVMRMIMLIMSIIIVGTISLGASSIAGVFVDNDAQVLAIATQGISIVVQSFLFSSIVAGFKAFYQGMGYLRYVKVMMVFQNFLGKIAIATLLGYFYGVKGIWIGFWICEVLTLVVIYIVAVAKSGNIGISMTNLSLLSKDFGQDLHNRIIRQKGMLDVEAVQLELKNFCSNLELESIVSSKLMNCITDFLIANYYEKDNHLEISIRLQVDDDFIKVRIRDNVEKNVNSLEKFSSEHKLIMKDLEYSMVLGFNNYTMKVIGG